MKLGILEQFTLKKIEKSSFSVVNTEKENTIKALGNSEFLPIFSSMDHSPKMLSFLEKKIVFNPGALTNQIIGGIAPQTPPVYSSGNIIVAISWKLSIFRLLSIEEKMLQNTP